MAEGIRILLSSTTLNTKGLELLLWLYGLSLRCIATCCFIFSNLSTWCGSPTDADERYQRGFICIQFNWKCLHCHCKRRRHSWLIQRNVAKLIKGNVELTISDAIGVHIVLRSTYRHLYTMRQFSGRGKLKPESWEVQRLEHLLSNSDDRARFCAHCRVTM